VRHERCQVVINMVIVTGNSANLQWRYDGVKERASEASKWSLSQVQNEWHPRKSIRS
jgi:hypothetical protein